MRSCTSPAGRLESHQRGFGSKHSFKCRRLKPWIDFYQKMSEEWKSRAQKPADFCWGTCLGISRGVPEVWARLAYVSFLPHDLVTGGIPHTDSRQFSTRNNLASWETYCHVCRQFWLLSWLWGGDERNQGILWCTEQAPAFLLYTAGDYPNLFKPLWWNHHFTRGTVRYS